MKEKDQLKFAFVNGQEDFIKGRTIKQNPFNKINAPNLFQKWEEGFMYSLRKDKVKNYDSK